MADIQAACFSLNVNVFISLDSDCLLFPQADSTASIASGIICLIFIKLHLNIYHYAKIRHTFFLQKHLFREEIPLFRFCRKIISGTSAVIARSSWECRRRNTERVCNRNNRFIWLQTVIGFSRQPLSYHPLVRNQLASR